MLVKLILGAALLVGGAVPGLCGYVPVNVCLPYDLGWFSQSALASDGVLDSYGLAYLKYGGVSHDFYCVVPSSASTSIVRLTGYTTESFNFKVTLRYADGIDSSAVFSSTANTVTTWYLPPTPAYIDKVFRTPDAIKVSIDGPASAYAYLYVGDVQIFSPSSSIDTIITPEIIEGLLQNATFQTTITSVSAVSNIADFLTFAPNSDGGKAAFLFGCVLALAFIIGIRTV